MAKETDIRVDNMSLYFLGYPMRVPFKFGIETIEYTTMARVKVVVQDRQGRTAVGWGETPLSATWVWPTKDLTYSAREEVIMRFCRMLAKQLPQVEKYGHPMELGDDFIQNQLHDLRQTLNQERGEQVDPMPYLAALVAFSAFDIAIHDAYGNLHNQEVYQTYTAQYMNRDLASYLTPEENSHVSFQGKYPCDYFVSNPPEKLAAWHLVGGVDLLEDADRTGKEPNDNYPVVLRDWIKTDGLNCLKVKLGGHDQAADYQRLVRVGDIAIDQKVDWLTTDFNCTVTKPDYVNRILDRLRDEHPRIYGMILYVEQPFPYDLDQYPINVFSVSARKPLFMDESAHDWRHIKKGKTLGWTGVALKTCKTQTGALLSLCWGKAHGMPMMVQDLTNPTLAIIPHFQLARHAGTIMGVETNAMQFFPDASLPEQKVHPGLYQRRKGTVDLTSIKGSGFGYRLDEIVRDLPSPEVI